MVLQYAGMQTRSNAATIFIAGHYTTDKSEPPGWPCHGLAGEK